MEEARQQIHDLDRQLVALIAKRVHVAQELAHIKRQEGYPTVDFTQERQVLDRARKWADEEGVDEDVAQDILGRLIEETVTAQEGEQLRIAGTGSGQSAVVVGGAGRMGRWLVSFLAAQGFQVHVFDPAMPGQMQVARAALQDADWVFMATPPSTIAIQYTEWSRNPPKGILCDISSVKEPILDALRELQAAGAHVTSIHPMFGPDARLLRDADVVVCDTGDERSMGAVRDLFAPTTAHVVDVPLEEHDMWMADVLALAHATVLSFAHSLPQTPRPVRSSTLGDLEDLAWKVAQESPEVYYEIQARNPHALQSIDRLVRSVQELARSIVADDGQQFKQYMERGRQNLAAQRGQA